MLIIWRAFCEYIKEKLYNYNGVNIKGFGAFTFEVACELPKFGIDLREAKMKSFGELIIEKKTTHKMRPIFVVEQRFKKSLVRFNDKEELTKPKSQASIYQKGFKMTYCNPIPIAASCYLPKNVIIDTLCAIFNAILDLINLGKNVSLRTGFSNIFFHDGNLNYSFNPDLGKMIENIVESESKVFLFNLIYRFILFSLVQKRDYSSL
jgi:nucleoid DNA-binding protein